jgi:hypothetical protein
MQAIELGIKTKKVVYRGEKCYKILDFSCYDICDKRLPTSYFTEYPFCFKDEYVFVVAVSNNDVWQFEVGDYINKVEFEKALDAIRVCGEKLHNLNLTIKEMRKEWNGEQEFKI